MYFMFESATMYKLNSRSQESTHYLHSSYLVNLFSGFSEYCPIHVVGFMLISNLISDMISNFRMLNHTINFNLVTKFMVWFNMEAIPKLPNLLSDLIPT